MAHSKTVISTEQFTEQCFSITLLMGARALKLKGYGQSLPRSTRIVPVYVFGAVVSLRIDGVFLSTAQTEFRRQHILSTISCGFDIFESGFWACRTRTQRFYNDIFFVFFIIIRETDFWVTKCLRSKFIISRNTVNYSPRRQLNWRIFLKFWLFFRDNPKNEKSTVSKIAISPCHFHTSLELVNGNIPTKKSKFILSNFGRNSELWKFWMCQFLQCYYFMKLLSFSLESYNFNKIQTTYFPAFCR